MLIKIKGILIETKEIIAIKEKIRDRFWNRHCGFIVYLHKKKPLTFEWSIPYESYPREIAEKKERARKLMDSIIEEWEKDRVIYPEKPTIKEFNI